MNTNIQASLMLAVILLSANAGLAQNGCENSDFESSPAGPVTTSNQVSGWKSSSVVQTNPSTNCNLSACCPNAPAASTVHTAAAGGYTDNVIGSSYPIYSVYGTGGPNAAGNAVNPQINFPMNGNNFLRIGTNLTGGGKVERISKTMVVTPFANIMDVAFVAVLARGHDCCFGSMFKVTINSFTCPLIFASGAIPTSCADANKGINYFAVGTGVPATSTNAAIFNKWTIRRINLSDYVGQTVTVNFTSGHCASSGHYGYAYIDTRCSAAQLTVNQSTIQLLAGTTSVSACGGTATLTAPQGFEVYQWLGPQGFSATTSSITASGTGTYTLSMGDSLACHLVSHTVAVMPQPTVMISTSQATSCAGAAVVLTGSGLATYNWQNGKTTQTIMVTPSVTTTYSLSGADVFGCPATQSITQNVVACASVYDDPYLREAIKVFPNPSHNEFTIILPEIGNARLVIENAMGMRILDEPVTGGENKIATRDLATGIYFYKVLTGDKEIKQGKVVLE